MKLNYWTVATQRVALVIKVNEINWDVLNRNRLIKYLIDEAKMEDNRWIVTYQGAEYTSGSNGCLLESVIMALKEYDSFIVKTSQLPPIPRPPLDVR
jgi:hypothetical protein